MSERVVEVVQAGVVPYAEALEWQRAVAQARIERRLPHDVLLLLEHPPVVTLGRNSHEAHLLRGGDVDLFEVERGGDVTYHGPGQLVGYPIIDLAGYRRDLHWYLRSLEQALIDALAELGVPAERKWVTWHGFALNVTTDLTAFDRIVPCGIPGVVMTSVERERGAGSGEQDLWDRSIAAVIRGFERAFGVEARVASRGDVEERRRGETCRTSALDGSPRRFSSTPL